jgi:hypothetical protein
MGGNFCKNEEIFFTVQKDCTVVVEVCFVNQKALYIIAL